MERRDSNTVWFANSLYRGKSCSLEQHWLNSIEIMHESAAGIPADGPDP
jgi:hypothetical protein